MDRDHSRLIIIILLGGILLALGGILFVLLVGREEAISAIGGASGAAAFAVALAGGTLALLFIGYVLRKRRRGQPWLFRLHPQGRAVVPRSAEGGFCPDWPGGAGGEARGGGGLEALMPSLKTVSDGMLPDRLFPDGVLHYCHHRQRPCARRRWLRDQSRSRL